MSHWNYRIFKYKDDLTIREVHYNEDGTLRSYSSEPALLHGEDVNELKESIDKMAQAIQQVKYGADILTEKDFGRDED